MTDTEQQVNVERGRSPIAAFLDAWGSRDAATFPEWVREVSRTFVESRLMLEAAARLIRTNPAELQAVLHLATMEDEDLELLAEQVPPKTTWFMLASTTSEGVVAAMKALRDRVSDKPPFEVVASTLSEVTGPDVFDRVAVLDSKAFFHMAKKAKDYGLLRPKDRQFLGSAGIRRRAGRPLAPRMTAWAVDLFEKLRDEGAIRRDSPDADQEVCDLVLDALEGSHTGAE